MLSFANKKCVNPQSGRLCISSGVSVQRLKLQAVNVCCMSNAETRAPADPAPPRALRAGERDVIIALLQRPG